MSAALDALMAKSRGTEVCASDVGAYLEQKAELEAAYARIKELMAEAEKEEVRWQERIAAVITSAGLTPMPKGEETMAMPVEQCESVTKATGHRRAARCKNAATIVVSETGKSYCEACAVRIGWRRATTKCNPTPDGGCDGDASCMHAVRA